MSVSFPFHLSRLPLKVKYSLVLLCLGLLCTGVGLILLFTAPSVLHSQVELTESSDETVTLFSPPPEVIASPLPQQQGISLNSASLAELDKLPGIGEKTAKKIITNRPYALLTEVVSKKVISPSLFEKIKDQLIL